MGPSRLVYGCSRMRQGSGYGGILVREMDNVVRGDANTNSLIVIIGRDVYMITIVTGSEGAPGTGIRSGRTSGGDRRTTGRKCRRTRTEVLMGTKRVWIWELGWVREGWSFGKPVKGSRRTGFRIWDFVRVGGGTSEVGRERWDGVLGGSDGRGRVYRM